MNLEVIFGILVVAMIIAVLWSAFCLEDEKKGNGVGWIVLIIIVSFIFGPPGFLICSGLSVLIIIGWFSGASKRKEFEDRMKREDEQEAAHNKWLREEREYQEYKKNHSSWW